ncbi:hypothetical protein [Marinivivus vitaminiproducens]|uniref:hypothetical protein n=1 Tax=Marinivivus vitaminiproducens TaxID=3035935 RepID=UPI0027A15E63|nr:hypothetical protein P4R82_12035 [Geminicoccaceae bacterium SCSIO 64248]
MGSIARAFPSVSVRDRAIDRAADASPTGDDTMLVFGGGPAGRAGTRQQMLDLLVRDLAHLMPERPARRRL